MLYCKCNYACSIVTVLIRTIYTTFVKYGVTSGTILSVRFHSINVAYIKEIVLKNWLRELAEIQSICNSRQGPCASMKKLSPVQPFSYIVYKKLNISWPVVRYRPIVSRHRDTIAPNHLLLSCVPTHYFASKASTFTYFLITFSYFSHR